jgi:hypothetical protein
MKPRFHALEPQAFETLAADHLIGRGASGILRRGALAAALCGGAVSPPQFAAGIDSTVWPRMRSIARR